MTNDDVLAVCYQNDVLGSVIISRRKLLGKKMIAPHGFHYLGNHFITFGGEM